MKAPILRGSINASSRQPAACPVRPGTTAPRIGARGALALLCLAVAGCGWPPLVRVQAAPDPFVGARKFALVPVAYSKELTVGELPEYRFVDGMSPNERAEFAADEGAVRTAFAAELTRGLAKGHVTVEPAPQPFVIEPTVTWIDPGDPGHSSGDGDLRITVRILRNGDAPLDVVDFRAEASGEGRQKRLEHVAEKIGHLVSDYLLGRVGRG